MKKKYLSIAAIAVVMITVMLLSMTLIDQKGENLPIKKPKSELFNEKFGEAKTRQMEDPTFFENVRNTRINELDGVSEPIIAINPADESKIAVAMNDFRLSGNKARFIYSENSGENWTASTIPLSGIAGFTEATDPALTYDSEGNLYFATIHYQTYGNGDGLFVNKSLDNGKSWRNAAVEVKKNNDGLVFEDRPTISADFSNSQYRNNIYVVWTSLNDGNDRILFSKSIDKGESFSGYKVIAEGNVHTADVKVDNNGHIFVAYLVDNSRIEVRKSIDGGESFLPSVLVSTFEHSGVQFNNTFLLKKNGNFGVKVKSFPSLGIDLATNQVLITYSAKNGNDLSDIFLVKSNDNGATWTSPLKVNNDNTTTDQFFPKISVSNGNIYLVWQDSRDDANNNTINTYLGISNVNNLNFTNSKISSKGFNPSSIMLNNYIGDYIGLAASKSGLFSVWTDGRNNLYDIYAGIMPLNPASVENEVELNDFRVYQNYPNPFNPSTVISYSIPSDRLVKIKLYDIRGKEIASLLNTFMTAGLHKYDFNMKSLKVNLSSGTYIYKVQFGEKVQAFKMSFVK